VPAFIEPQAVAVSPYGWLMSHYGWLAVVSMVAAETLAAYDRFVPGLLWGLSPRFLFSLSLWLAAAYTYCGTADKILRPLTAMARGS